MAIPKKHTAKRQAKKTLPGAAKPAVNGTDLRSYTIRDYRLEKPNFTLRQIVERKKDGGDEGDNGESRYFAPGSGFLMIAHGSSIYEPDRTASSASGLSW